MWAYAVSFQLDPALDYSSLFAELEAYSVHWNCLPNLWLIVTGESAIEIWNRLAPCITQDDRVLIIEVRNNAYGLLPEDGWDWINASIPQP